MKAKQFRRSRRSSKLRWRQPGPHVAAGARRCGASLDLGFEHIEGFGSRLFTRLNILASDSVRLPSMIEATDMPNARDYGVRLLGELGCAVTPELELTLRGGYQARAAVSGGVSLGAGASLGFRGRFKRHVHDADKLLS